MVRIFAAGGVRQLLYFALTLWFVSADVGTAADHTYDSGYEPTPPVPFPVAYKDHQILPYTISPDHRYAFIYPKRSRLYELPQVSLYRQEIRADFEKSLPEDHNDYHDFIFDTEDRAILDKDKNVIGERGWELDSNGHVMIDCTCTNDPKGLKPRSGWIARFTGKWDISVGTFLEKTLVREPSVGRHDEE